MDIRTKHIEPKLTLVGAGPGDPELITVKGMKVIAGADVILYDALIDKTLLEYAQSDAIKVFVGKRGGRDYIKQNQINELIVEYAFQYGHVVRLKGGDPFVFGRGHEELDYAHSFGVTTDVIPGITSAIAVPELQRIPVTRRGMSESFWVITGSTKEGKLSKDLELAAQSTATIVVLMGMRKLPEIVALYNRLGISETPVGIIQNGTTRKEKIGLGTMENIMDVVSEKGLKSPAIIIIGKVVEAHPRLSELLAEISHY
ncbi:MAG: uroporphyrinogen-III C-methyltransferase [Flavobacteriales bacterium]|nr:uroporphyrinogen-III C-methyltransferase [Flavobacteriales bacterium]